ncbi:MAG: FAD-dependent oxidoreductase [Flavobacteriaceae bacterium]|nr:FAD-dependent oxidoreductase [Flavobacteriaceae bacterium]
MKNIIIIGGGIIGLSTAYYLQQEGCKVSVIDKSNISKGASFVNAGYISPSHVIPLAAPGMVGTGLKMMLNTASPFYLKPRFDIDLWRWAWAFKKSATAKHVKKSAPIIKDLTIFSRELYQDMKNSQLFDFHYEQKGMLMCYQTAEFEDKEALIAEVAKAQGLEVKHIGKETLLKMEPELKAKGAFYYLCDAHTTPGDFMQKMHQYLASKGVAFYTNETVLDFNYSGSKIQSVSTSKRNLNFDELVIASGSWSPSLAKKLGIKLLVQAGKGYRINVHRPTGINYPAILAERNTAVSPMAGFTRFGGTMEISGINHNINFKRVKAIADAAKSFYPNITINKDEMRDADCGLRPLSPDGLPFIGRTKKFKNLCFATGHAMMGWSQGPATGKIISEIITDKKPTLKIEGFNPNRKF